MKTKYYVKVCSLNMKPRFVKITKRKASSLLFNYFGLIFLKCQYIKYGRKQHKLQINIYIELQRGSFTEAQITR